MNIALVHRKIAIGGISQSLLNLGGYLVAHGHKVTIVSSEKGEGLARFADVGLMVACLPIGRWENAFQHTRRLARYLQGGEFDVVMVFLGIANLPGQRCLRFLPPRMIRLVALRTTNPLVFGRAEINGGVWDMALAVSPAVERIASQRLPGKAVQCIPTGVFCPSDLHLVQRADWSEPLRLLFVGRLANPAKNIVLLPEILRVCVQEGLPVTLTVIGDGPDRSLLERAIRATGMGDLIELRGMQPATAVYQAMRAHHVLLMPSNSEGFPNVLLEAQANGCVPIASHLPGITDIGLADGVSGLLASPGDAAAFAHQIATLYEPERWRSFSQAAIQRARSHFSIDVMGERYLALMSELVANVDRVASARGQPDPLLTLFGWKDFVPSQLLGWMRSLCKRRR